MAQQAQSSWETGKVRKDTQRVGKPGGGKLLLAGVFATALIVFTLCIAWGFNKDITAAHTRVAHGSKLMATRCGPIEYLEAGTCIPLLVVHGGGGGYDRA